MISQAVVHLSIFLGITSYTVHNLVAIDILDEDFGGMRGGLPLGGGCWRGHGAPGRLPRVRSHTEVRLL